MCSKDFLDLFLLGRSKLFIRTRRQLGMRSEVLGLAIATINTAGRNNSCSGVGVDSAQVAVRKQGAVDDHYTGEIKLHAS